VPKDSALPRAYGTVDEFNAIIGMVMAACRKDVKFEARLLEIFSQVQSRLFDIGADLATPEGANNSSKILRIEEHHVAEVESWIDEVDGANPPLKTFVMPSGCELAARLRDLEALAAGDPLLRRGAAWRGCARQSHRSPLRPWWLRSNPNRKPPPPTRRRSRRRGWHRRPVRSGLHQCSPPSRKRTAPNVTTSSS
jgi:hypothetical protein